MQQIAGLETSRAETADKQAAQQAAQQVAQQAQRVAIQRNAEAAQAQADAGALTRLALSLANQEAKIRASYAKRREIVAANNERADPARLEHIRTQLAEEEALELQLLAQKEARKRETKTLAEQAEQQRLLEKYAQQQEAGQLRYELEQQVLIERREAGIINRQQYSLFVEQAEAQHLQRLQQMRDNNYAREQAARTGLNKRMLAARKAKQRVEQHIAVQEVRFAQGIFGQLLSGAAQHNKQAFELDKASRVATAAINAHAAASQALAAWPPPFSAIAAGAAYALGMVQVNAIRNQKFGGGAGGGSGGGAGGGIAAGGAPAVSRATPPTAAIADAQVTAEQQPAPTGPREITIDLHGERFTRQQVRALLEQFGEEANLNLQLNGTNSSDGTGVAA